MKKIIRSLIAMGTITIVQIIFAENKENPGTTRIGVYDSRSIAIAFIDSGVYKKTDGKLMAKKMKEYKKAKEEENQERIKELEAWGEERQALLHKQGFSTAPVNNILAHISDQLPEIKKQAQVEVLVSKWDDATLAKYSDAKKTDVTMLLVDAFQPHEKQRKSAREIQKKNPVPLEK